MLFYLPTNKTVSKGGIMKPQLDNKKKPFAGFDLE
jgi:hypothetical protein